MMNVNQIGENAGKVWKGLGRTGDLTSRELAKILSLDTDEVNMALGWLARENKLKLSEKNRNTYIGLSDAEKKAYAKGNGG